MTTTEKKAQILVVDDDAKILQVCATFLEKVGHDVTAVDGAAKALRAVQKKDYDIVLTDIRMPGVTGDVLIKQLAQAQPDLATIIMTGYPTMELAIDAVGKGVYEFVTKPFKLQELSDVVERALERRAEAILRQQRRFAASLLDM